MILQSTNNSLLDGIERSTGLSKDALITMILNDFYIKNKNDVDYINELIRMVRKTNFTKLQVNEPVEYELTSDIESKYSILLGNDIVQEDMDKLMNAIIKKALTKLKSKEAMSLDAGQAIRLITSNMNSDALTNKTINLEIPEPFMKLISQYSATLDIYTNEVVLYWALLGCFNFISDDKRDLTYEEIIRMLSIE